MTDQVKASHLAKEAFELWQAGNAELAVPLYLEALQNADPDHWALADYHGELAGALASLDRHTEARNHYQLAVSVQRRQDGDDFNVAVTTARYFLADRCLQLNEPLLALEAIAPSMSNNAKGDWLLHLAKARALHALGKVSESHAEADLSIKFAPSEEKRKELMSYFSGELGKN
jgi:hypothetical protein